MSVIVSLIIGTTRAGSQAPALAKIVQAALESRGATVNVIEPSAHLELATVIKPFHHQGDSPSAVFKATHDHIVASHAVVTVSGEYNHAPTPAVLAVLDNFHHETWKAPKAKAAAIVSFGGQSQGGARSGYVLRNAMAELGLHVIPSAFNLSAPWSAIVDGKLGDDKQKILDAVMDELLATAKALQTL